MAVLRVLGLLVLGVAVYYSSFQVPEGTAILTHVKLIVTHAMLDVMGGVEWLGLGDQIPLMKKMVAMMATEAPPGVEVQEMTFEGIPVRVYIPRGASPDGAGVMYFHGGGWVTGSVGQYNRLVADIAEQSGMVVVSVEYRLAPERTFPFAFEDCTRAVRYFIDHAAEFKVNPNRIAVAGDSAGGNLAAAVSLKLKDQLKAQILIYPALQAFDFDTPSYQITGKKGLLLNKMLMVKFWLYYAQGDSSNKNAVFINNHTSAAIKKSIAKSYVNVDSLPKQYVPDGYVRGSLDFGDAELWKKLQGIFLNPFFAPLAAPDVSSVPQAMILTAEYDVLRDDGILYAQKLQNAGVKVSHYHSSDGIHGMIGLPGRQNSKSVEKMYNFMISFMKENL